MINKTKFSLIITLLIAAVSITGCLKKECKINNDCPAENCITAECRDNKCAYIPISDCCGNETCETNESYSSCAADCPNCDDNNKCTTDSYDYHERQCVNAPNLNDVCCGNGVCEIGETYTTCMQDCPDCDDGNKCTNDKYDYPAQKCINAEVTPCCGNGICDEGAETSLDCQADCPDCDDDSRLTADSFDYTAQKCKNVVTHYFIDDFEDGTPDWDLGGTPDEPQDAVFWTVTKEGDTMALKGTRHNWAALKDKKWDNFIFKARFKRIKGLMHFNYRLSPQIRYLINVGGDGISLSKQVKDEFSRPTQSSGFKLSAGWHVIEIRGYGDVLNVLLDGKLLLKYKDMQNPILSGGIGLEILSDSEFLIDDIEIKVIVPEDVVYP